MSSLDRFPQRRQVPGVRSAAFGSLALLLSAFLAGCATPGTVPSAGAGTAKAASVPAGSASAPAAEAPARPGMPPPFETVTKDAKRSDGFLPTWTKDAKTWLEIPAERLEQPFFLGTSLASGLGERFFLAGLMGREQVVVLRRVDNTLQLLARNLSVRAPEGSPLAGLVRESYSDSLLAAAPIVAAPSKDGKALLVDADVLLGGDLGNIQFAVDRAFRTGYALDRANSSFVRERTGTEGTYFTRRMHFAVPKLPTPPVLPPGAPPPNLATLPSPASTVPDARSFFIDVAVTLAPLPATPMRPRVADQRVGYFTEAYRDIADESSGNRDRHLINRWRLEKKDPAAPVSVPMQPIRVVMDRNIPERWRAAVRAGILAWNAAFERAGFRDALQVEQQPADADWASTEGTRMLAVRWFTMEPPAPGGIGPSQVDPRTGEILRGAALIYGDIARLYRNRNADVQPRLGPASEGVALDPLRGGFARRHAQCDYAEVALEQARAGFELLAMRGGFDPDGPEADRFIEDALKNVVMHEIGHTLGLRHNFRASTSVTRAQLRDPKFTSEHGIASSVMDYQGLNIPLEGETVADYHMVTLGAYDHWAIEYGYRAFAPADEAAGLAAIAARSDGDPRLAYATDEDFAAGDDPDVVQSDLGDDVLAFADRQLKLSRELLERTQKRELAPDDDYTVYRRNLERGLSGYSAAVPMLVRHVGGLQSSRSLAGAGRPVVTPVPAARQRQALDLLLGQIFDSASFRFSPDFMSRLGVDQFDRRGAGGPSMAYSLPSRVLAIQRPALDRLMSDALAQRLADAEAKVDDPSGLLGYAEVQARLSDAVWSELKGKAGAIDGTRRTLQREHIRRLAAGVLRATSPAAADVRAVHRQEALALQTALKRALASKGWSAGARAHLADSEAMLSEALKAPLGRQGV